MRDLRPEAPAEWHRPVVAAAKARTARTDSAYSWRARPTSSASPCAPDDKPDNPSSFSACARPSSPPPCSSVTTSLVQLAMALLTRWTLCKYRSGSCEKTETLLQKYGCTRAARGTGSHKTACTIAKQICWLQNTNRVPVINECLAVVPPLRVAVLLEAIFQLLALSVVGLTDVADLVSVESEEDRDDDEVDKLLDVVEGVEAQPVRDLRIRHFSFQTRPPYHTTESLCSKSILTAHKQ